MSDEKPNPTCQKCKGTGAYLEKDPRPGEDDPMPVRCEACFPPTEDQGWLSTCGQWNNDQIHCSNCGEQPPAGCPCSGCQDGPHIEDEDLPDETQF